MKNDELKNILNFLKEQRGFDFNGYRTAMLERRVQKRMFGTKCDGYSAYLDFLQRLPEELDQLVDVLTINVSHFFRNSLSFEYLRKIIIPELYLAKTKENDDSFRVWSAGCSFGEEPYSVAILINEFLKNEESDIKPTIFATDIDKKAIKKASVGRYSIKSIKNIKFGLLTKYFTHEGEHYYIDPQIKEQVHFSVYDIIDQTHLVPPDSIFGGFDIVLCRNVLIYFEMDYQKFIFNKLYKSLKPNGYLILGEAEVPIEDFKHKFKRINNNCKIYRKIG